MKPSRNKESFWLTRFIILRLVGFIYFVAFLVAANQLLPLVGHNGLSPADAFLAQIQKVTGSRAAGFVELPGLFWFGISDRLLMVAAWTGVILSLPVCLG